VCFLSIILLRPEYKFKHLYTRTSCSIQIFYTLAVIFITYTLLAFLPLLVSLLLLAFMLLLVSCCCWFLPLLVAAVAGLSAVAGIPAAVAGITATVANFHAAVAGIHVMSFQLLLAPVLLLVFLPSCCLSSPQAVSRPCGKLHNGEQHGAASSPALQVGSAPPDQFHMGRLPAQPKAVCRPCGEHLPSPPPSQLHRTMVRGTSLPAGPLHRGRPQDLATSSSSGISDAVAKGGPVESGIIICTKLVILNTVIPVILLCLIWEGLLVKIRQSGYEEKILQLHMRQSSPESC
jgi:hypothetical protein